MSFTSCYGLAGRAQQLDMPVVGMRHLMLAKPLQSTSTRLFYMIVTHSGQMK